MLRALIVDSVEADRDHLCDLLAVADPPVQIVGAVDSVAAARAWLKSGAETDLFFLAPGLRDGPAAAIFDVAPEFAAVVFVTAPDPGVTARFPVYRLPWLAKPVAATGVAGLLERFRLMGPACAGRFGDYLKSARAAAPAPQPKAPAKPRAAATKRRAR